MTDFAYCGTDPPVAATNAQKLLRKYQAIWCPSSLLPKAPPHENDRIWLIWRDQSVSHPWLLGGGRIKLSPSGNVVWDESNMPGVRETARDLGYGNPTAMKFIVVKRSLIKPRHQVAAPALEHIHDGLNQLIPPTDGYLQERLQIE